MNPTRREFIALAFGALAAIAAPKTANAATRREFWPKAMQKAPTTTQNGIMYVLHGSAAAVAEIPNRHAVTIPDSIRHGGRSYTVTAIWQDAFSSAPRVRRLTLKAKSLQTVEDIAAVRRLQLVICHDASTCMWLRRAGVRAVYRAGQK